MSETQKDTYHSQPFVKIERQQQELQYAIENYLRITGWTATSNTPGAYWMWEKTVTNLSYYKGDTRHNRTWLVSREDALRLQTYWDAEEYAHKHPDEFED